MEEHTAAMDQKNSGYKNSIQKKISDPKSLNYERGNEKSVEGHGDKVEEISQKIDQKIIFKTLQYGRTRVSRIKEPMAWWAYQCIRPLWCYMWRGK